MKKEDLKIYLLAGATTFFLVTMLGVLYNGIEGKELDRARREVIKYKDNLIDKEKEIAIVEAELVRITAKAKEIIKAQQKETRTLWDIIYSLPHNQTRQNWRCR